MASASDLGKCEGWRVGIKRPAAGQAQVGRADGAPTCAGPRAHPSRGLWPCQQGSGAIKKAPGSPRTA